MAKTKPRSRSTSTKTHPRQHRERPLATRNHISQRRRTIGTWIGWASLIGLGIIIAGAVTAVVADEVPFEDRHVREFRSRVRALVHSRAPREALAWVQDQIAQAHDELQSRLR